MGVSCRSASEETASENLQHYMMTIQPTILRTQGRLSDFMAEGDRKKMKIKGKTSRPWVINNAKDMQKYGHVLKTNVKTDFNDILRIHHGEDIKTVLHQKGKENADQRCHNTNISYHLKNLNENYLQSEYSDDNLTQEVNRNLTFFHPAKSVYPSICSQDTQIVNCKSDSTLNNFNEKGRRVGV